MAVSPLYHEAGCGGACRAIQTALLRLVAACPPIESVVQTGTLVVDRRRRTVTVAEREVSLSAQEWAILDYLAEHVGQIRTSDEILTACWGAASADDWHLLRSTMGRLRWKLGRAAALIQNAKGRGYRLVAANPGDNAPIPALPRAWAKAWQRCRDCDRDDRPHGGGGRCNTCAKRWRRQCEEARYDAR